MTSSALRLEAIKAIIEAIEVDDEKQAEQVVEMVRAILATGEKK